MNKSPIHSSWCGIILKPKSVRVRESILAQIKDLQRDMPRWDCPEQRNTLKVIKELRRAISGMKTSYTFERKITTFERKSQATFKYCNQNIERMDTNRATNVVNELYNIQRQCMIFGSQIEKEKAYRFKARIENIKTVAEACLPILKQVKARITPPREDDTGRDLPQFSQGASLGRSRGTGVEHRNSAGVALGT